LPIKEKPRFYPQAQKGYMLLYVSIPASPPPLDAGGRLRYYLNDPQAGCLFFSGIDNEQRANSGRTKRSRGEGRAKSLPAPAADTAGERHAENR